MSAFTIVLRQRVICNLSGELSDVVITRLSCYYHSSRNRLALARSLLHPPTGCTPPSNIPIRHTCLYPGYARVPLEGRVQSMAEHVRMAEQRKTEPPEYRARQRSHGGSRGHSAQYPPGPPGPPGPGGLACRDTSNQPPETPGVCTVVGIGEVQQPPAKTRKKIKTPDPSPSFP